MKKQVQKTLVRFGLFSFLTLLLSFAANAQNISVSGVIKDISGEPLPGVTIGVKGTNINVAGSVEGKYSVSVHPDSLLVFSSIGFKTQIVPVGGRTIIDVIMNEESEEIDEAVVIGYGTIKKSHLTGSVSKIKNEKLDQIPLSRVDDALVGQIAGVNVQQTNPGAGEAPVMRVRGQGSISFDSNPLIVVDGIVVGNDADFLSSLDMNDVESVEVLKDASSGAIYGSRGANGIIMITTKKGVEGPTKFSYHGYVGIKSVPDNDVLTTPNDWFDYVRENNEGALTERLQYVERLGTYTDWTDVMYDGGIIQSHAISARGGTKNTKFQTSLSYLGDEGVLLTDNFQKLNFRVKVNTKLREKVSFGFNLNPSYTTQRRFPIGVHDAIRQSPWLPLYLDEDNIDYVNRFRENGRWEDAQIGDYAMERMFDNYDLLLGQPDPNDSGTSISTTSNQGSLAKVLERDRRKHQTKVYANTYLKYDLTDNISFKQTFGGDFRYTKNSRYIGVDATRNGITDSESTWNGQVRWHTVSESTVNWNKEYGGHSISAVGGFAYEAWNTEITDLEAVGFSNDLIQTLPASNLSGGSVIRFEEVLVSYLGRVNYNFNERYLLSASLRRDGSSKFGPDSKYGWFPAISAGWMVTEESFFPKNSIFNELKIRASYGVTGNNNGIGEYDHLGLIEPVGTGFGSIGYNAINIENPRLQWEKLVEVNPGIDVSLLNEKINMSLDYYNRVSQDLLLDVPIPSVTGFETALVNRGEVKNEGVELELLTRNVTKRNFSWSTSVVATRNKNTLVDFAGADGLISIVDDKRAAEWIALEGNPISSFYGYVVDGEIPLEFINDPFYPINAQSQDVYVRDLNGDGLIDTDDRTVLGSPYPDVVWSVTNNFKYKNWDLTFMFQGSHGAEVRNISSQYYKNEIASSQDFVTGFEDANLVRERIFTSDDIQDASYLAIRNVNVGYTFPAKIMSKAKIRGARVYVSAQNLIYIMAEDYVGFNPEGIDQGLGNPLTYGYQRGPAPLYRSFSIGVNLDF
ncbi:MAG: SusC/RagA family TonB-linked outer membrane protein [Flavobacteriales bacterium]